MNGIAIVNKRRRWAVAGAWALLLAGLTVAFANTFSEMWTRWFPAWHHKSWGLYDRIVTGESYYTHGPLMPAVSLLIAILLIRHTRIKVRPMPAAGFAVLGLSLLVHLTACLARVNFVSGFAFVGVLCGLVLALWGPMALRRLWFPLALLLFMVPLPDVSISNLNFRLKMMAAGLGVRLVGLLGVVAARSGNQVFLEGGKSVVIANVCNGLRTLISLLAFGALYAYVCRLRGLWRIGLFAMTIPVAVVSNAVRVVSLILVAHIWDVDTAVGWFHDFSGIFIFVLAFLLMFGLERTLLGVRRLLGRPAKIVPLFDGVRRSDEDDGQWSAMVSAAGSRVGWVAAFVVAASAGGAVWLNQSVPAQWDQQMVSRIVPRDIVLGGVAWRGYDHTLDDRTLAVLETRDYLYRRYIPTAGGAAPMELTIVFSEDNRKGTHPPDLCIEGTGQDIIAMRDVVVSDVPGRGDLPCRELTVQSGDNRQYLLYTYKCGSDYTASFWRQQFVIFLNGLLRRNAAGALIRVSTPLEGDGDDAPQRLRELLRLAVPYLDKNLP